jgi:hypothetical protein
MGTHPFESTKGVAAGFECGSKGGPARAMVSKNFDLETILANDAEQQNP